MHAYAHVRAPTTVCACTALQAEDRGRRGRRASVCVCRQRRQEGRWGLVGTAAVQRPPRPKITA
eukprot:352480-Chlamydomonas_euryale.AAC.5